MRMVALIFVLVSSCSWNLERGQTELTLLTWNVQNLFDDVVDGMEYPEFDPERGRWNRAQFWRRAERAAEVILASVPGGPDIVALQEVENPNVAQTLNDRFLAFRGYRVVMVPEPRSPVQTVFLTRFEPRRVHVLRVPDFQGRALRPILEMELAVSGRRLVLYNNHWKSRRPDPESTSENRRMAGRLLSERAQWQRDRDPEAIILALGDFNSELKGDEVFEGWTRLQSGEGTFWFQGEWSMIDHILSFGFMAGAVAQAQVWSPLALQDSDGRPRRWSLQDKDGISDHFPILMRLVIQLDVSYTDAYGLSRFGLLSAGTGSSRRTSGRLPSNDG